MNGRKKGVGVIVAKSVRRQPEKAKRRRQPEKVKAQILAAAFTSFANHGFSGASTRLIAKDANVNLALLLYHFQSKESLWKAVLSDVLQRHAINWEDFGPNSGIMTASEKLRIVIRQIVHTFAEVPELYRLMTQEGHQLSERLLWLCDTFVKDEYGMLSRLIVEGQRDGKVRTITPGRLRFAIIAIAGLPFSMAAEYQYLTKRSPFVPSEIEATIELINRLVFEPV